MKNNTREDAARQRASLPKFLLCDDGADGDFVLHTEYPRFLKEFDGIEGTPYFLDDQAESIEIEQAAGREPTSTMARLLREAGC